MKVYFDKCWPSRRVVEVDGVDAGGLVLDREKDWLFLSDLGLLPSYRKRGLGSQIIADVNAYADANGLNVELQVLVTNPARHLYECMGFEPTHLKMYRASGRDRRDEPAG